MSAPETTDRTAAPHIPDADTPQSVRPNAQDHGTGNPGTRGLDTERPGTRTSGPGAPATAVVNGSPVVVTPGLTVAGAVSDLTGRELTPEGTAADGHPLGIAVAVDDTVVPRSLWATTPVEAGRNVEIVTAVQGG